MSISLTVFKSMYDTKTNKRMDFDSFDSFEKLLYKLSKIKYKKKTDAPLISPATYKVGESRKNINVIDWGGWCALDVDDWFPDGDLEEIVKEKFKEYRFVCYSTASSTIKQPKFRLVFQSNDRIPEDKIKAFWYAVVEETEMSVDPQCKDLSRMYYVPGTYDSGKDYNWFIFSNYGDKLLDIDNLIEKHPAPPPRSNNFFDNLPEDVQKEILERKKQQLTNTSISWTSYTNCPFWPKALAAKYIPIAHMDNTGRYRMFYQIMVAIASNAIKEKYPITPIEIAQLCFEFDAAHGSRYKNRNFEYEASRALEYAYRG